MCVSEGWTWNDEVTGREGEETRASMEHAEVCGRSREGVRCDKKERYRILWGTQ